MMKPTIFALGFLGFLALVSAVSGLESNPLVKIDKYLSKTTNYWFEPAYNFMIAEEYYEYEKQASHTITSNKKLLETLEDFLGLKPLLDGDRKENCNVKAVEKLKQFGESLQSQIRSLNHLPKVYNKIRATYAHKCHQEFYDILDEKLETMKDLDVVVSGRLHDFIEIKTSPKVREYEVENAVSYMYGMIISKEDSEILEPRHIQDAYRSCKSEFGNKGSFEDSVQKCWLNPCEQYVDKLANVFSIAAAVHLEPDVGTLQTPLPKTQRYFEHWAQFRICQVLLSRGASQLEKDVMNEGARQ